MNYTHRIRYTECISPYTKRTNKTTEQINLFNYLGNMISYEKQLDIDNKLHNYLKIIRILNNVFRPQRKSP